MKQLHKLILQRCVLRWILLGLSSLRIPCYAVVELVLSPSAFYILTGGGWTQVAGVA